MTSKIAVVTGASTGLGRGIAVCCDHSKDDEVKSVFERVRNESGQLDILVNNAAAVYPQALTAKIKRDFFSSSGVSRYGDHQSRRCRNSPRRGNDYSFADACADAG